MRKKRSVGFFRRLAVLNIYKRQGTTSRLKTSATCILKIFLWNFVFPNTNRKSFQTIVSQIPYRVVLQYTNQELRPSPHQ